MPPYGYAGRIVRVNLTGGELAAESYDNSLAERFIGGTGYGARLLYDESPTVVDWAAPENPMVFANGPLSYTAVGGSGMISVTTKGPMTHLAGSSQGNGYFGAYLKSCGYDGMVIRGAADTWSYLLIGDGHMAIKDAAHLVGKDTQETQALLKKELGIERGVSIYCVGPAAERGVNFSIIMGDGTHAVSKNGMGAVLAAKKIKAIVVLKGGFRPEIYDKAGLKRIARELHAKALTYLDGTRHRWGTAGNLSKLEKIGQLPVRNYTTSIFPQHARLDGHYVRSTFERVGRNTCFNCGIDHLPVYSVTQGPYKGFIGEQPEYEAVAAFGPQIGQTDPGATFVLTDLADRLGLDANECGWVVGWAMECFEKGIISSKDTDGIDLFWGNVEAVRTLLGKIASREGFGDLLAGGVRRAAMAVGGEALDMGVFTCKGSTPRGHDHRGRWSELVDTCLSNTSTIEATSAGSRPHILKMPPVQDAFSPREVPLVNAACNGWHTVEDSLGVCHFNLNHPDLVTAAYNAATNAGVDIPDLITTGKRVVNVLRVFNILNGVVPAMEAPSKRYGSKPIDGPAAGIGVAEHWPTIREHYYRAMGWDPQTGIPLPATLKALDLEDLLSPLSL